MKVYGFARVEDIYIEHKDGTLTKYVPEKHGKWEWVYDGIYDRDWRCSVCNKIPPHEERTKYCPNCGARMDGDCYGMDKCEG